ncbi:MAG: EamA family transporter [Angustibacter sp.]
MSTSSGRVPVAVGRRAPSAVSGAALALLSMSCVQIGAAASVGQFDRLGVAGTTWLRLVWAALVFVLLVRPWRLALSRAAWSAAVRLGVVSAGLTLTFFQAVERLPLGTAVALEFLGPLTVAVVAARRRAALVWPVLALAGVLALTRPWTPDVPIAGVGWALAAAGCWAAYIVLTQRVGDVLPGLAGLAVSMPVAAVCAMPWGLPQAGPQLDVRALVVTAGLAVLLPILPWAAELVALRRLSSGAFAVLMCLEPAIGTVIGALVLAQAPQPVQALGVALVMVAGIGATRSGARRTPEARP